MKMPEAGVLECQATMQAELFGIVEYYGSEFYNYYDLIQVFSAEQTDEPAAEPEPTPGTMSVKRTIKKNVL